MPYWSPPALLLLLALWSSGFAAPQVPLAADPLAIFQCDACLIGMQRIAEDVQYLIQKERAWRKPDLIERVDLLCKDPGLNQQQGRDQCEKFLRQRREEILELIRNRQNPLSEEFEESMPNVRDLCGPEHEGGWGACRTRDQKTMAQMMADIPSS